MPARASICAALMLVMVIAPASAQAPVGQPLNAKVQETLMGPTVTGGLTSRTVMSEDGEHLAHRLAAILKGGADAVGCQSAGLYLLDETTTTLKLRAAHNLPGRFSPNITLRAEVRRVTSHSATA